jgi:hypothetical protein
MKTYVYLFFCLFSLMGFQACSNDEVDNDYEKEFAFYSILSYAYSSYRYKHLQQRH